MATADGTWAYRSEHQDFARTYFRRFGDCIVSSIGVGTYLGEPTDATDSAYRDAIELALESGINVVDTAINYRHQRSERVVGEALRAAAVDRDAVLVATKGGFVPFDGQRPDQPGARIRERYLEADILDREDLARGQHAITPSFIDDQLDRSLRNTGLETIDLYYVHNPETQLKTRPLSAVYDQLEATFTRLEERVAAGDIRHYGVATWDAFRVQADADAALSLTEILARASRAADHAGVPENHLQAIQLPFNVQMADAFSVAGNEAGKTVLELAHEADIDVFSSASLMQGELATGLPAAVDTQLDGETPAQRAINFARSAPGVTTALVGMASTEHVHENIDAGRFPPLGAKAFDAVFK
jgi:aryl-alcohol dehydrogenase-like predicted oxidoreductase